MCLPKLPQIKEEEKTDGVANKAIMLYFWIVVITLAILAAIWFSVSLLPPLDVPQETAIDKDSFYYGFYHGCLSVNLAIAEQIVSQQGGVMPPVEFFQDWCSQYTQSAADYGYFEKIEE